MTISDLIRTVRRKRAHKRFVDSYINTLRWDIVNTSIESTKGDTPKWDLKVQCCAQLIRKYERRRKLLEF
jgi:hypothetical protein